MAPQSNQSESSKIKIAQQRPSSPVIQSSSKHDPKDKTDLFKNVKPGHAVIGSNGRSYIKDPDGQIYMFTGGGSAIKVSQSQIQGVYQNSSDIRNNIYSQETRGKGTQNFENIIKNHLHTFKYMEDGEEKTARFLFDDDGKAIQLDQHGKQINKGDLNYAGDIKSLLGETPYFDGSSYRPCTEDPLQGTRPAVNLAKDTMRALGASAEFADKLDNGLEYFKNKNPKTYENLESGLEAMNNWWQGEGENSTDDSSSGVFRLSQYSEDKIKELSDSELKEMIKGELSSFDAADGKLIESKGESYLDATADSIVRKFRGASESDPSLLGMLSEINEAVAEVGG